MNGLLSKDSFLIQLQSKNIIQRYQKLLSQAFIQKSFFTLDNANFWYLTFIYDFLFKCVDLERIHFIASDKDSGYFAIAGDMNRHCEQYFNAIIANSEFYNKNVYKFMPNPFIGTKADEKKILGAKVKSKTILH